MAVYLGLVEDESNYDDYYPDEYDEDGSAPGEQDRSSVQPVDLASITTLYPRTYNDARTIGEHFREGTPVIINLTELTGGDARRLVDFAAGLIFGLRGSIDKVTNRVFLLTPANAEVRPAAENTAKVRPAEESPTTSIQARKDRAL
jgi:cell division inhibitor SepF